MPQVRANGIDIEYESIGREGDPAVLLVMGFATQLVGWPVSLCNGLAAEGFRVIRFDNRDIGKSTHLTRLGAPNLPAMIATREAGGWPAAPYSLDDMAADAAGLLDALGIARAHVVGASMGGMIAQQVAIHHPAKTKSLVSIMSTTGRPDLPPAKPEAFAAIMTPPASLGREDRIERGVEVARVIGSPGFPASEAELRETVARGVDRTPYDPVGIARQMAAVLAARPRNDRLKALKVPALVIHGADDPLIPASGGEDTARSIPGAELLIVPGMAHDLRESVVPVYLKAIGAFIRTVEARERAVA
jgi:pimeloyl-ACP methyl ester carboxylesterase